MFRSLVHEALHEHELDLVFFKLMLNSRLVNGNLLLR
jgi:hypothetical protein